MTRPLRLTIYRQPPSEWRVTLRTSGGSVADVSTAATPAPVFAPVAVSRLPHPAKPSKWRWTLRGGNGSIVAASTQGYARRAGVEANIALVLGLDVTGIKPGDVVTYQRRGGSRRAAALRGSWADLQTIRVEVR